MQLVIIHSVEPQLLTVFVTFHVSCPACVFLQYLTSYFRRLLFAFLGLFESWVTRAVWIFKKLDQIKTTIGLAHYVSIHVFSQNICGIIACVH